MTALEKYKKQKPTENEYDTLIMAATLLKDSDQKSLKKQAPIEYDTVTEYMKNKYANREDKDNIFGVGITDDEFIRFIIDYLLGKDWYVVDPLGRSQILEVALCEILEKYSKQYKKELKQQEARSRVTK